MPEEVKRGRGKPATGRTTHMIRVKKEVSKEFAEQAYFDWLPVLEEYAATCQDNPRYDRLRRLLHELGFTPQCDRP